jgi:hypothetical protein
VGGEGKEVGIMGVLGEVEGKEVVVVGGEGSVAKVEEAWGAGAVVKLLHITAGVRNSSSLICRVWQAPANKGLRIFRLRLQGMTLVEGHPHGRTIGGVKRKFGLWGQQVGTGVSHRLLTSPEMLLLRFHKPFWDAGPRR